ncbi:hypothetical protein Hanom_Chr12g01119031 [Helianthus anomalus]
MADRKLEEDGVCVSAKSKELVADCDPSKPPKRNKYAFACAMLASMTSCFQIITYLVKTPINMTEDQ